MRGGSRDTASASCGIPVRSNTSLRSELARRGRRAPLLLIGERNEAPGGSYLDSCCFRWETTYRAGVLTVGMVDPALPRVGGCPARLDVMGRRKKTRCTGTGFFGLACSDLLDSEGSSDFDGDVVIASREAFGFSELVDRVHQTRAQTAVLHA